MRLRISLVSFLNAAPLGWYFLHGPDRHLFEITLATPADCARQLAGGEADVGLIPAIEYQRIPNLKIVPGVAVAASDEVRSVLLVHPRGKTAHGSVALDTSSRTSVALVKLLLCVRQGLNPEFVPHEPDITQMLAKCDAALLIGDAALKCSPQKYDWLDLAAEWRKWQGRPFIFALWACRSSAHAPGNMADIFGEAQRWGLERCAEIAEHYARNLNLPADFLLRYLQQNLDHSMGAEHLDGLERFYRLSFEHGLIDQLNPLRFSNPPWWQVKSG